MSDERLAKIIEGLKADFPPLPPISDAALADAAVTHSTFANTYNSLNLGPTLDDYEKLEHVGDSLLNTAVTLMLHDTFPKLDEGGSSKLRSLLVRNITLAQLSVYYGLPARLRVKSDVKVGTTVARQTDIHAALFEAHVGASFYSVLKERGPRKDATEQIFCSLDLIFEKIAIAFAKELGTKPGEEGDASIELASAHESMALTKWSAAVSSYHAHKDLDTSSLPDDFGTGKLGLFNEWHIKHWKVPPEYEVQQEGEQHDLSWTVSANIKNPQGGTVSASATRKTVKLARSIVAGVVLKQLGV